MGLKSNLINWKFHHRVKT